MLALRVSCGAQGGNGNGGSDGGGSGATQQDVKMARAREQVARLSAYEAGGDVAKWRGAKKGSGGDPKRPRTPKTPRTPRTPREGSPVPTAPDAKLWATRSADVSDKKLLFF